MDLRQSPQWGNFLSLIGWQVEKFYYGQVFIRKIPLFPISIIKIQRAKNPLPFKQINQLAKKYHAICGIIEPNKDNFNENLFKKHGYKQDFGMSFLQTATLTLDLTLSEKQLFRSFSENARRNIKKSQVSNLKIETIFLKDLKDDSRFKEFFSLLKNLTKMKGFYIPNYKEFHQKMLAFKDTSVLFFAYSPKKDQPIAVVWMGYFGNTAVYMHAGNTKEGYQTLANYLLVWEACKLAQKLKLKVLDFEGLFDPRFPKLRKSWSNFSQFKRRFHGTVIEYPPPYIKCYNLGFKLFYLCSKILTRS